MHVVLAMSPAGSKFRQRTRMNPSLIACCTIDWFDEWNTAAMLDVAHAYVENADLVANPEIDKNVGLKHTLDCVYVNGIFIFLGIKRCNRKSMCRNS